MTVRIRDERTESGFSVVELLIAISILTIGILALGSLQISAIRGNATSGAVSEASNYVVDKTEKLMRLSYHAAALTDSDGDAISGIDDATAATADHSESSTAISGKTYNLFWNIAANQPRTGAKTVKVIATWDERGGQKSTSLDFIKADM